MPVSAVLCCCAAGGDGWEFQVFMPCSNVRLICSSEEPVLRVVKGGCAYDPVSGACMCFVHRRVTRRRICKTVLLAYFGAYCAPELALCVRYLGEAVIVGCDSTLRACKRA